MYKSIITTKKIKNNWVFLLISHPDVYLFGLILNTMAVGIITLGLNYLCLHYNLKLHVPTTAHQLVSIAIGLLLVFRTQTSYERWSTASKNFNDIYNSLIFLTIKIEAALQTCSVEEREKIKQELGTIINSFGDNFKDYLKTDDNDLARKLEIAYLQDLKALNRCITNVEIETGKTVHSDTVLLQKIVMDIISACGSCVKIKNTPIPMSYALHIKVSISLYILSLPFGLFSELGAWSTVMVMFVYYIIAGIEIISKEIENPFYGDLNDLPIDKYIKNMQQITAVHFD